MSINSNGSGSSSGLSSVAAGSAVAIAPSTSGQHQDLASGLTELSKTNLYIRGLSPNTVDQDLVDMCASYGNIMSTKAIMDKATNKCKGYGFVDFESSAVADLAVKSLQAKGIQAQMAKVGIASSRKPVNQQEQDPTNLYFANLPPNFKENDLEHLLSKYGNVVSTRILRDNDNISKGVGFARMDTKEKCEKVIQAFNSMQLPGGREPLLIKFADGGPKKRVYKGDIRLWREAEGGHVTYNTTGFLPNTVTTTQVMPTAALAQYARHYGAAGQPITAGYTTLPAHWLPQYIVQPTATYAPTQMDVQVPSSDSGQVMYGLPVHVPQLPTMQIATPGSAGLPATGPAPAYLATTPHATTAAYPYYTTGAAPGIIHTLPIPTGAEDHHSSTGSPDEYQHYSLKYAYDYNGHMAGGIMAPPVKYVILGPNN